MASAPGPVIVLLLSLCCFTAFTVADIGVCYGMLGDNLPVPADTVALYKQYQINSLRLYDPNPDALSALRDSGITVTVGVRNEDLQSIAGDQAAADQWVATNLTPYSPAVSFKYVAVGNEVIPGTLAQYVVPAMQNLGRSIVAAGIQNIGVSTAVSMLILGNSYPPSSGSFSADSADVMKGVVDFLTANGSPLLLNAYPYVTYVGNPGQIALPYALFTSPGPVVQDGDLNYQNLFDAMVDAVYAAMEKSGAPNVRIVVAETGWPSAGADSATIDNAQTYNNNFIAHVQSATGTPRRPGNAIEAYVFAMFNEDQKQPAGTENNFGLFLPNKQPVYLVRFH